MMKHVNKIPHYTISELTDSSDETDVKTSNFTFVLFFSCTVNDYILLLPTNAHIILIYCSRSFLV